MMKGKEVKGGLGLVSCVVEDLGRVKEPMGPAGNRRRTNLCGTTNQPTNMTVGQLQFGVGGVKLGPGAGSRVASYQPMGRRVVKAEGR